METAIFRQRQILETSTCYNFTHELLLFYNVANELYLQLCHALG